MKKRTRIDHDHDEWMSNKNEQCKGDHSEDFKNADEWSWNNNDESDNNDESGDSDDSEYNKWEECEEGDPESISDQEQYVEEKDILDDYLAYDTVDALMNPELDEDLAGFVVPDDDDPYNPQTNYQPLKKTKREISGDIRGTIAISLFGNNDDPDDDPDYDPNE